MPGVAARFASDQHRRARRAGCSSYRAQTRNDRGLAQIAFRLLVSYSDDPLVFERYLRVFVDAYPYSAYAIEPRKNEPIVAATLREALADEEDTARAFRGRPSYSRAYVRLAEYLAELGDRAGQRALARARKYAPRM